MALAYPTAVRIELELSAGVWTDVSDDVLRREPLRARYGIAGNGVHDRVAGTGFLSFALDNIRNAAGLVGRYSPGHANCRAGWALGVGVRLVIVYGGVSYYKWRGTVKTIRPQPGENGAYRVWVEAVDWMDEAAKAQLSGLAVQQNKRADEIFATIVAAVERQPASTEFGIGSEVYPYALDIARDEALVVMTECARLAASEIGYVYVKGDTVGGGKLVFEDRRRRATRVNPTTTLSSEEISLGGLDPERSRDAIITRVQVICHPRRVDTAATAVLFQLESATKLEANTTRVFSCPYRDPNQRAVRVGGIEMVAPVAGTDFAFYANADGSGSNLTVQLTVSATFGGNAAEVTVTNTGATDGYLTRLQLRGKGIYAYEVVTFESADAAAAAAYGENALPFDMPYQSKLEIAQDAAGYLLALSKPTTTIPNAVTFLANCSEELLQSALAEEISSLIRIEDPVSAVAGNYFVQSVEIDIDDGTFVTVTWGLAPALSDSYWILERDGYTELDETTRLAFGLFNTPWILGREGYSELDETTRLDE